jgi:predicted unusual protein kinase regulating ubiquinone biosynthesis (AarF/ABC1/UbiB family)
MSHPAPSPAAERTSPDAASPPRPALAPARPAAVALRLVVVVAVFAWYGLRRVWGALTETLDGPTAARLAFERLGPIYVKLGQLIASGEALFPERYSEAFRVLLDRVPPFAFAEVVRVIEADTGERTDTLFASLDPTPLAAASIAQVHCGALRDGREVVVKVQRPEIAERAAADVAILRVLALVAERLFPIARGSSLVAFVEDFATNLAEELDFRGEAARIGEFRDVMRAMDNRIVTAPEVFRATPRVLVMERFHGLRIDDYDAVRASGVDPEERLREGIRGWFQSLILRGFFHGDVHAGNFMLLHDRRIGFLDFGIVGRFAGDQRMAVLEYVIGFQQRDYARVADAMVAMDAVLPGVTLDRPALVAHLGRTFAPMSDGESGLQLRDLVPAMVRTGRAHGLRMPRDLVLVTKQLVYLDRYSRAYGGAKMSVLTDQQLTEVLTRDMMAAMFAR